MADTENKDPTIKSEGNAQRRPGTDQAKTRQPTIQRVERALEHRPLQIGLVVLFVLVVALLIGPSPFSSRSMLDTVRVGYPAQQTIKVSRDFTLPPSPSVLAAKRAEAAKRVLPVFDLETDKGALLIARLNRAFTEAATLQKGNVPPRTPQPQAQPLPASDAGLAKATPQKPPTLEELRERFSQTLGVDVPEEVFAELQRIGFSGDVKIACLAVIGTVMDQLIVSHRAVIRPFEGQPVAVRYLVGGRVGDRGEDRLTSFSRVMDLKRARALAANQTNVHGAKLPTRVRRAVLGLVRRLVVANVNLTFNRDETDRRKALAQATIRGTPRSFVKGEVIVRDGTPVTAEHRRAVEAMESIYRGVSRIQLTLLGLAILVAIVLLVVSRFASGHFRRFTLSARDMLCMGALAIALLGLTRGIMASVGPTQSGDLALWPFFVPVAAGAMLVRLLIGGEAASLFAVILAAFAGMTVDRGGSLSLAIYYLVTSLVGAAGMATVQSRQTILRAGLFSGAVGLGAVVAIALFGGHLDLGQVFSAGATALGAGIFASFLTLALLPALEWLFSYTTDVTLLELANLNHPLLRELMLRAPGTYHHSMVVGNLSEAACEAIGANSLLAHVAANFHDVGKMKNSPYFAENFKTGDNPHNRLKPSMSALIIRSHVKDSIDMCREHGIPEQVISVGSQHHGTTLIEFFYHKAIEQAESPDDVREEEYRYPGPKPQTREAGVIMLADGIEAAARSLSDPTEDRLRTVVQRVINGKFADGQLDHCDLTLRDLHIIAKSFLQVLRGIYHQRPTYPWQRAERDSERPAGEKGAKGRKKRAGDTLHGDAPAAVAATSANGTGNGHSATRPATTAQVATAGGAVKQQAEKQESSASNGDSTERPGQRSSATAIDTDGALADSQESSPDIKRLGLS
ncbi:MAG: HDIG domain-containing protein [Deltaproteobacteria bacterium]|nr:HDIG domain-containing protein [Deltaproteobacteria bacterium]